MEVSHRLLLLVVTGQTKDKIGSTAIERHPVNTQHLPEEVDTADPRNVHSVFQIKTLLLSEVHCLKCRPESSSPLCGISGYECKRSSQCCENYCCVRGFCERVNTHLVRPLTTGGFDVSIGDSQTVCNPCDEIVCQGNETCQIVKDPKCVKETCDEVPRCFPFIACNILCKVGYRCVVDYSTNPPTRKCVPKMHPCDNIACPEFQQCYLENTNCWVDPNEPIVVCAYSNPCDFYNCPNGSICSTVRKDNGPPKAQCVPQCDQCPEHQKCYLRDVQSFRAPQPECAYYNPCMFANCSRYQVCKLHQKGNNPPTPWCEHDYKSFCGKEVCPELQRCYLKPDAWLTSTSPFPPETVCDYYDLCLLGRCPSGSKCVTVDNGHYPPSARCVPSIEAICNGTVCPAGQRCYLKDVDCETRSCLPQPQCAYENPCIGKECATGYSCIAEGHGDNPPTPICVYNPKSICLTHKCPPYQKCYLVDGYCKTPPCLPEPVCGYPDPCLFACCDDGCKCTVIEESPNPPTAYCLKTCDFCYGVNCKPGYSCYVKNRECTDFECSPIPPAAVCSLADPCAETKCAQNSVCETIKRPGRNPPEAKCVLPESPCDKMVCTSNEQCYIKDLHCNATTCLDINPLGVCASPDPCRAERCLQNTTCQVVQIRRNPPKVVCGQVQEYNPCDGFVCFHGYKCYVKDVRCSEFGCEAQISQPVCSQPDPCNNTLCPNGTVCFTSQTRNNPPVAECKPLRCLCDGMKCGPYQQCYIRDYECGQVGCSKLSKPYAVCAPVDPCAGIWCSLFTVCNVVRIRDNPPQAVCVLIPPVIVCNMWCSKPGYACCLKDMICDDFRCTLIKPEPICALIHPCSVASCKDNTICVEVYERNNPPKAVCKFKNPCDGVVCSKGEQCFIKDFECNKNGRCAYIKPEGVCGYFNPCNFTVCESVSTCLVHQIRDNPPFAICGPKSSPCDTVDCPPGDSCYVEDFHCDKYSCRLTKRQAVCAPANPCRNVSCPANSVCIPYQIRSNPPSGYCISHKELCTKVRCGEDEKCHVVPVYCIRAPCPWKPTCFPANPCASFTCLPGYRCVNRQYGGNPPFAECVQLEDPCNGVNCSDSQQCYLKEKPCSCPPCGYEAACADPNPCFLERCPQGHGCYPKRVGRLAPIPVCYPADDPCKVYECLPGQECVSMELTKMPCKIDLPCPVTVCMGDPTDYLCRSVNCLSGFKCVVDLDCRPLVAKCVHYRDPCEYTICPVESSCVVIKKYPPEAHCLNVTSAEPCSVVQCKPGYRCEETNTDPVQAVCVGTCLICPPTTTCEVIHTSPPMITCCPNPKWLISHDTL